MNQYLGKLVTDLPTLIRECSGTPETESRSTWDPAQASRKIGERIITLVDRLSGEHSETIIQADQALEQLKSSITSTPPENAVHTFDNNLPRYLPEHLTRAQIAKTVQPALGLLQSLLSLEAQYYKSSSTRRNSFTGFSSMGFQNYAVDTLYRALCPLTVLELDPKVAQKSGIPYLETLLEQGEHEMVLQGATFLAAELEEAALPAFPTELTEQVRQEHRELRNAIRPAMRSLIRQVILQRVEEVIPEVMKETDYRESSGDVETDIQRLLSGRVRHRSEFKKIDSLVDGRDGNFRRLAEFAQSAWGASLHEPGYLSMLDSLKD